MIFPRYKESKLVTERKKWKIFKTHSLLISTPPSLVEKSPGGKLAADTIPGRSQYTQEPNCTWSKNWKTQARILMEEIQNEEEDVRFLKSCKVVVV